MFFFLTLLYQLPGHAIFFNFLVSVNHYHINGLHLFWDSFEWFCFQVSCDAKYFSSRHCDRGLIVVIIYYFQIWNKREHSIIISRVISSHMGPMFIETLYINPIVLCFMKKDLLCFVFLPLFDFNFIWYIRVVKCDSLTARHEITLDRLHTEKN